jgi:hypothetical protein
MNTNSHMPTAKIYRFPVKSTVIRPSATSSTGKGQATRLIVAPNVEFGSGWYHDCAIQAERSQKP